MIDYLTGKGAPLMDAQLCSTGKVLVAIFEADPADADIAGEALVRLVLSFLVLPADQHDPDLAATVIARTVTGILEPGRRSRR